MSKRYILQKDLPEMKAGAVIEWDDREKRYAIYYFYKNDARRYLFYPNTVENNPEWFLPDEPALFGLWCPVSDRNPISMGDYLVTNNDGSVKLNRFNLKWWYGGTIAWMPLPKPYQP